MKFCALISCLFFLVSCSGYRLGGHQPAHLQHIDSIYVPLAENRTLFPRIEAHLTNSVVSALSHDGTYRIGTFENADASLQLKVRQMTYREIRSDNRETLRAEELELEVLVEWSLLDLKQNRQVLESGTSGGKTRFFVDANLQTARRNAVPDAVEQAAQHLVSRLADGF